MTSTFNGVDSYEQWENLRRPRTKSVGSEVNVGRVERVVSGLAGAALIALAWRRARGRGVLFPLGGSLIGRAVTGRCPVNRAMGRNSARGGSRADPVLGPGEGIRVEQSVTIDRPVEDLFRFWRNLENLPRFMDHLESVTVLSSQQSHWIAKGPVGSKVEWDAEVYNEIEDELIAWRSLPGSDVDHAGSVHFIPIGESSTGVRVVLRYEPPAGRLGAAIAGLFGEEPSRQVADDLRRLKQVMEAGASAFIA